MKWKTTPDGQNVAASPVADWLTAKIDDYFLIQLRYQTEDEQGSEQLHDQPFVLPVALAEQLAAQILETCRTGDERQGNPASLQ
ncbi:hypothetical protein HH800_05800 [Sphingobium yanoikuyae]|uniref:Uncharacterized protein n=1 Tax=Sphingobium yanoikuyae TaxID=13690 RepID=A0A6M4G4B7_SPHYA|nr:hypothetical protein [Sphingobium yanoikuyae]QJR01750.1 hypothetical protein HH800_05800 [Sphingobium yanoikuyae]